MQLRPGETIIFEGHPSWRSVLRTYIIGDLIALAVGALVWFVVSPFTGIVVGVVIALGAIVVGFVQRRSTRYVITNERLYVRRGLLSRHEQQTRVDRVQDVATFQGPLERILQIGTVDFDTAGDDKEDFRFAGVDEPQQVVEAVDAAQRASSEQL